MNLLLRRIIILKEEKINIRQLHNFPQKTSEEKIMTDSQEIREPAYF